ncbi:MAG: peptide deformylase [Turicibacter sp.]|nr:peptide deformylase [Turicibacter sp.]
MITMEDIITDGHPLLRTVVDEVPLPLSDEDKNVMKEMAEFLANSQDPKIAKKYGLREGVGLAAPQIGLNKRILAVRAEDSNGELCHYALANPKMLSHSEEKTFLPSGEGCLSVEQDIPGIVPRYRRLKLNGYDIEGNLVEVKAHDFIAIVFQHELDHLNGKMFYDHIDKANPLMPPPGMIPL